MFNRNIICILLLIVLTASKTSILNLPENWIPKSEMEYANYLQVMLGHHVESAFTSDNIKALINNERPSILTAPEKVVLLLATLSKQDTASQGDSSLHVQGAWLSQLIEKYQTAIDVKVMLNVNYEQLQQEITKLQSQGSLVNAIIAQEKTIHQLEIALSQPKLASSKRRLQSSQFKPDNTYLIRFFFSIIFILVIVACVGFIAQNEGKKDTLLYAKFIADVGAR